MFGLFSNPVVDFDQVRKKEEFMAPGTRISFDADLTERLRAEHHEILGACEELEIDCIKGRAGRVVEHLHVLEEQIRQHRMREDVKLLVFIEKRWSGDAEAAAMLTLVRKERDQIRKQLVEFFDKYSLLDKNSNLLEDLCHDIAKLGSLVVRLIEREENDLFPLYIRHRSSELAAG